MEAAFWAYWEDSSRPIAVLLSFLMAVTWPVGENTQLLCNPMTFPLKGAGSGFCDCYVVACADSVDHSRQL